MKKLWTGLALIGLAIIMTAASQLQYKVYLPLVFNAPLPVYEWHSCTYDLYDSLNIQAGQVKVWLKIEYHPDGQVRLVQFYDNFEPPTYTWTYFKWHAKPFRSWWLIYEINLLWMEPVGRNKDWNNIYVESVSAWEAVTHIGGSKGYTLNPVAFKKGHYRYPIDCIIVEHIGYPYPYPEP